MVPTDEILVVQSQEDDSITSLPAVPSTSAAPALTSNDPESPSIEAQQSEPNPTVAAPAVTSNPVSNASVVQNKPLFIPTKPVSTSDGTLRNEATISQTSDPTMSTASSEWYCSSQWVCKPCKKPFPSPLALQNHLK